MWKKPEEISGGAYASAGYEVAAFRSDKITAETALEQWHNSPSHRDVILNKNRWTALEWRAMGAAMSEHYAVVWFGEAQDVSQ